MKIGSRRNIQLDDEGRIKYPLWKFFVMLVTLIPALVIWIILIPFGWHELWADRMEELWANIPRDRCRNGKCLKEFPKGEKLIECPWCFTDLAEDQRQDQ